MTKEVMIVILFSWGHLLWTGVSYFYNWLRVLGLQPLEDEYEINPTGSYYSLSSVMNITRESF